ncbi:MAG: FAD-dependent oxidoreductase [Alphaproteobacteria bacterium]|nr:FAD-dependent oxidoreductase [Alphaproteobacteria bacterium]
MSDTAENFLAADKCFSASHMANGATRLQPLILNLGQACGAAAALAIRQGRPPAALSVRQLQNVLIGDPLAPAAVVPRWDTPWYHSEWRQRQMVVLDNPERLSHQGFDPSSGGFRLGDSRWYWGIHLCICYFIWNWLLAVDHPGTRAESVVQPV